MCRSSLEASCSASNRTMWEEEVTLEIWRDFDRKWPKMWLLSTSGVFWEFLWPLLNLSLCTAAIVVLVWAWCHFPAPALTRKSPRQIPIVLLLQASVFSEGYFLLPKTCPERVGKLPSVRASRTAAGLRFQMAHRNTPALKRFLLLWSGLFFLFIFLIKASTWQGSGRMLSQISRIPHHQK